MSISKSLLTANATATIAAGSGVMAWVADNAPALGIFFTGTMVIVSTTFYLLNYLEKLRHHKAIETDK